MCATNTMLEEMFDRLTGALQAYESCYTTAATLRSLKAKYKHISMGSRSLELIFGKILRLRLRGSIRAGEGLFSGTG